jgi:hypothetical protein
MNNHGGKRVNAGRRRVPLDQRYPVRGKIFIGISPEAALQLQDLMLHPVSGVETPEQLVEYLIRQAHDHT